mmetsp:Transcript_37590/g.91366  ORF Transcript_37590/g.91366 Transcript_37590/m.91366 type:complete len:134 (+) Transcript_37590:122-523(+)
MVDMTVNDLKIMAAGAGAWAVAIPAVKIAGNAIVGSETEKSPDDNLAVAKTGAAIVGVLISVGTSKFLPHVMDWKTPYEKVRGIAIALGTAQTIDGLVHIFCPAFYATSPAVSVGCAANIFFGAGLLGLFSAY